MRLVVCLKGLVRSFVFFTCARWRSVDGVCPGGGGSIFSPGAAGDRQTRISAPGRTIQIKIIFPGQVIVREYNENITLRISEL